MRTLHAAAPPPASPGVTVTIVSAAPSAEAVWGRFDTPVGPVIAIGAESALWALGLAAEIPEAEVRADLAALWPGTRLAEAPPPAALVHGSGELRVRLSGTDFQMAVWRALTRVPAGEVISYATLAERIGRPTALRAVGTAVGQNPVAWAIPCHRVTRTGGALGGYHWGAGVKRALLAREGARVLPPAIAGM